MVVVRGGQLREAARRLAGVLAALVLLQQRTHRAAHRLGVPRRALPAVLEALRAVARGQDAPCDGRGTGSLTNFERGVYGLCPRVIREFL